MKVNAEEDHVFVVDQASKDNNCKLDIPGGGEKYYSSICRIWRIDIGYVYNQTRLRRLDYSEKAERHWRIFLGTRSEERITWKLCVLRFKVI